MSEFFKFSVKMERLNAEVSSALGDVEKKIPGALQFVGAEMKDSLLYFLEWDWYYAWGEPRMYERDTDAHPSEGLMSPDRMDVSVDKKTLLFTYDDRKPKGVGYEDDIIKIIGQNDYWDFAPSIDAAERPIKPRPFWNNFVKFMMDEGIMNAFSIGMTFQGLPIIPENPDLVFEPEESIVDGPVKRPPLDDRKETE